MTFPDCVQFAVENPVCSVATVEGDQPRVRIFMIWRANENGFYLCSGMPKAVCQQIKANPKTELCFYKPGPDPMAPGIMMRVAGEAEFVDDVELRTQLLNEWPFLKQMGITGPEDPMLALMRIGAGEIKYWTSTADKHESVEVIAF